MANIPTCITVLFSYLTLCYTQKTLFDTASDLQASVFTNFLTKAGLKTVLEKQGNLTLFAPVNLAFDNLPQGVNQSLNNDPAFLKQVMNYHIVNSPHFSVLFSNEQLIPSAEGANLRINKYPNKTTVSGSEIILFDIPCTNGYLFMTNRLVYPVPSGSAYDLIASESDFTTLLLAVTTANIPDMYLGKHLTVFAPSNKAFSDLPPGELPNLLDNIPKLQEVLRMHLVGAGTYFSVGMSNGLVLTSIAGTKLTIGTTNGLTVNGISVNPQYSTVTNGLVYTIDKVMLPSTTLKYRNTVYDSRNRNMLDENNVVNFP